MTPRTARMIIEGIPIVESTSAYGAELKRLRRMMRTSSNKHKEATYVVPVDRFPPQSLPKP